MKKLFIKSKFKIDENSVQDFVFLFGIFVFFTVLIIGLFPGGESGFVLNRDFFIYTIMTIPVIAAIYFIVMSFRRTFYNETIYVDSSIKNKMALAFVFVALLPALIIVLASNNFINKAFTNIYSDKTSKALEESIVLAEENIDDFIDRFEDEVELIKKSLSQNSINLDLLGNRETIISKINPKDVSLLIYGIERIKNRVFVKSTSAEKNDLKNGILEFILSIEYNKNIRIERININNADILIGSIIHQNFIIILYREIPGNIIGRRDFFVSSLADYKKYELIQLFFKSNIGIFLLVLSIFVIVISILISFILSKNITRPVMELVEAVKQLAYGNFNIKMYRKSNDELGLLFNAFNQMVMELENNKKVMYQKQKLEAWREMATKLVHEIKNPLTPIRLSAERMRRRFIEKHKDIDRIILSGSETIIEEVDALMAILREFTNFARLPEMKPEKININQLIENCIKFFSGHENIKFHINLDDKISNVNIDKILFRQVITNLVQNAIRAVNENGNITVITEAVRINNIPHIRIHIIDDGIGIDAVEIEKIFEPGYSKNGSGTGLGLSIVEMIVYEHDGKIYCKSEKDKGADFYIDLPLKTEEGKA